MQYADDTTLTLKCNKSVSLAIAEILSFSEVSGLKLNTSKSQGLWLGKLIENPAVFEGISFTDESIKNLGIYLNKNMKVCLKQSWEDKLNKVEKTLKIWSNRKLTLFGKCKIINSLVVPKLIYLMTILEMDAEYIRKLENLIFTFLWAKSHKIKKCTVIGPQHNGGLGVIDLELKVMSLKASWVPKMLKESKQLFVINTYLSSLGLNLNLLLKMNFRSRECFPIIKKLPEFYQEIIIAFNKIKSIKPITKLNDTEIFTQCIWGN